MAKNRLKVYTFSTHPFINNEFVVTNNHHRALKSFCVQNCRQLGVPAIPSLGLSSALPLLFLFLFLIHRWRSSKLSDYNNFNGISFNAFIRRLCFRWIDLPSLFVKQKRKFYMKLIFCVSERNFCWCFPFSFFLVSKTATDPALELNCNFITYITY